MEAINKHIAVVKKSLHLAHHKSNMMIRNTTDTIVAKIIKNQKEIILTLIDHLSEMKGFYNLLFYERRMLLICLCELEIQNNGKLLEEINECKTELLNNLNRLEQQQSKPTQIIVNKWNILNIS